MNASDSGLDVLMHVAGGVALLLWAVRMVRTGVERAWGPALRRLLTRASRGRLPAFLSGIVVALSLQSATAASLLAMGFVTNGLLATAPGLAIMLGADLGSALAVQVLALDLRGLSPLLLLCGVTLFLCSQQRRNRQIGRTVIGLGLILLSLSLIGEAGRTLGEGTAAATALTTLGSEPGLIFLAAALATWAMHSSVAAVLLIAAIAGAGIVPLEVALPMMLGANAGAGLVPLVLSLRRSLAERRLPLANLCFRGSGAIAALLLLPVLWPWVGLLGDEPARQIVNAHLVFNLLLAATFLPLVGPGARIVERWTQERTDPAQLSSPLANPTRLDDAAIDNPGVALSCASLEVLRMADWVETMLRRSVDALQANDRSVIAAVARIDNEVDAMYTSIKNYMVKVSRNVLSAEESERCVEITSLTVKLEQIGDIVEKNLLQLAKKRLDADRRFSEDGWAELCDLHQRVVANFQLALNVFVSRDVETARLLIREKDAFRDCEHESARKHLQRLRAGTAASIDSSPVHLDVIRDLAQINSLIASTAYPILEQSGELLRSRLRDARPEDSGGAVMLRDTVPAPAGSGGDSTG